MNECRITEIHKHPHAPWFALTLSGSQNRSSSGPVHPFLLKPVERFGACSTAHNAWWIHQCGNIQQSVRPESGSQSSTPHAWSTWGHPLLLLPGWNNTVNDGTWTHTKLLHIHTCIHTFHAHTHVVLHAGLVLYKEMLLPFMAIIEW